MLIIRMNIFLFYFIFASLPPGIFGIYSREFLHFVILFSKILLLEIIGKDFIFRVFILSRIYAKMKSS